jgi:NAD+ diphosphatase
MDSAHGGHMRRCPTCARETFPRIDSAVIMLVETTNETGEPICLLGRHARLPTGIFSTLAGFVETGESLEETVVREVMEESGVKVDRVDYRGSQPWPLPASLMLGFRARATTTDISAHDDELEAVAWFTAEELSGFGEWSDEAAEFRLPRRDSIARVLIDEWLAEHRAG